MSNKLKEIENTWEDLTPQKAGKLISDIFDSPSPLPYEIKVNIYRDLGCQEFCRHEGCGAKVEALIWEFQRPDKSGHSLRMVTAEAFGTYGRGILRMLFPEVVPHTLIEHESFNAVGSETGKWEISPRDIENFFEPFLENEKQL